MSDKSAIEWTDACSICTVTLNADNRVEIGRALCKRCRNTRQRARYVRMGHPGRRGFIAEARNDDRKQARRRVNYLVEQGLIPRPSELGCMDCGDGVYINPHRHEYDHARGYDADNQLYVEPVCSRCHHNREDARRGKN